MFRRCCPDHVCNTTGGWLQISMRSQHRFKSSLIWSHCPQTQILCHKLVSPNFNSSLSYPTVPTQSLCHGPVSPAPLAATSPLPRPSSSRAVASNPVATGVSTSSLGQRTYPSVASAPPLDATSVGIVVVFPLLHPWSHSSPPPHSIPRHPPPSQVS